MAALTLAAVEDSDTAAIAASSATLTDAAWAEICAAAKHASDAEARVVLSAILFNDYPGFTYDRARVAAAAKRARRMLKNFAAFEADYRAQFAPADNAILDDPPIRIKPDLRCLEGLRRRTEAVLLVARTLQRANARRRNVQREMLYYWLCTMWLNHFHAELTYRRRPEGGDPYGPADSDAPSHAGRCVARPRDRA